MKYSYQFSNLLGGVYHKGNVLFSNEGKTLFSPVGNRLAVYDLEKNMSQTLPFDSRYNITCIALSPDQRLLITVNEKGESQIVSTLKMVVLHTYRFNTTINCIKFSPDGVYFACTRRNSVFVYITPSASSHVYNPFVLKTVLSGAMAPTTYISWSSDSRFLIVGSNDMSVRVHSIDPIKYFSRYCLASHSGSIMFACFAHNSLDCYTISCNGQLFSWVCNHELSDLKYKSSTGVTEEAANSDDSDIDESTERVHFKLKCKHSLFDAVREGLSQQAAAEDGADKSVTSLVDSKFLQVSAADYHQRLRLLTTGFSNGVFLIYEMPEFTHMYTLSMCNSPITALCLSSDWVAVGSHDHTGGHLLVWEWLTDSYVLKQQSHSNNNNISTMAFSSTGDVLATGSFDGKLKLWNVASGFCYITFTEHKSRITSVRFVESSAVVISASLDGTIRAFDLTRYRNFRTLTSPRAAQFTCMSVDYSGEMVAAGAQDVFDIYLWSLKLGKLLEILGGHEGPVSQVEFNSTHTSTLLASVSWDKTLKVWDVLNSTVCKDSIELLSEGLSVSFRPDAENLAVSTLSGHLYVFSIEPSLKQLACIDGRSDLGTGKSMTDQVSTRKLIKHKAFTTLCYSADGSCLLAGGQCKNICLYRVKEQLLIDRLAVTRNCSLDGIHSYIERRKMCEFGNMDLVESRTDYDQNQAKIRMPGSRHGDKAARRHKPLVHVFCVCFSPTGEMFGAVTTEGVLLYSVQPTLVFDPFRLDANLTKDSVLSMAHNSSGHSLDKAVLAALDLNLCDVTTQVLELVPFNNIDSLVASLPERYIVMLLNHLLREFQTTLHVQLYVTYLHALFVHHLMWLRAHSTQIMTALRSIQSTMSRRVLPITNLSEQNRSSIKYILQASQLDDKSTEYTKTAGSTDVLEDELDFMDSEMTMLSDN